MHRGNAFLIGSALLLTGISACKYHPTVEPSNLLCHDDNGCPLPYYCVGVAGNQPGFCCDKQDAAACFESADALPASRDSIPTDASSDGIAGVDSSISQDLDGASDGIPDR